VESVDASFSGEQATLRRFEFLRFPVVKICCPFSLLLLRVGDGKQYALFRLRGEGDGWGMLVGTGISVMMWVTSFEKLHTIPPQL